MQVKSMAECPILSTFIKLPPFIKICVLDYFCFAVLHMFYCMHKGLDKVISGAKGLKFNLSIT